MGQINKPNERNKRSTVQSTVRRKGGLPNTHFMTQQRLQSDRRSKHHGQNREASADYRKHRGGTFGASFTRPGRGQSPSTAGPLPSPAVSSRANHGDAILLSAIANTRPPRASRVTTDKTQTRARTNTQIDHYSKQMRVNFTPPKVQISNTDKSKTRDMTQRMR